MLGVLAIAFSEIFQLWKYNWTITIEADKPVN